MSTISLIKSKSSARIIRAIVLLGSRIKLHIINIIRDHTHLLTSKVKYIIDSMLKCVIIIPQLQIPTRLFSRSKIINIRSSPIVSLKPSGQIIGSIVFIQGKSSRDAISCDIPHSSVGSRMNLPALISSHINVHEVVTLVRESIEDRLIRRAMITHHYSSYEDSLFHF